MTNGQSLLTLANGLQIIADKKTALQVQIYLLQQIAGNTMTGQQLITAANGMQVISDTRTAEQVIIYLLNQIAGGGGSGGDEAVTAGAYGVGNPPNFTPTTAAAISINTSDGVEWTFFNGVWQ